MIYPRKIKFLEDKLELLDMSLMIEPDGLLQKILSTRLQEIADYSYHTFL
ncbi:hypothetical protein BZL35_00779 [Candidatus Pandoraea novymonadis]|uniref:Uncharacterized protein n=1 Tax=Candidatus Pandoraea novymonadis TaxID=1808959 RepID=A0ABX5FEU9_9BURK|nr:hypothetical protein BZL35_00779 [Candidatus Pandoraea novymonadis]